MSTDRTCKRCGIFVGLYRRFCRECQKDMYDKGLARPKVMFK